MISSVQLLRDNKKISSVLCKFTAAKYKFSETPITRSQLTKHTPEYFSVLFEIIQSNGWIHFYIWKWNIAKDIIILYDGTSVGWTISVAMVVWRILDDPT